MTYVLIAIGGAAGAVTRFALDSWVSSRASTDFPFGTLVINVSGSLVLGILFALTAERGILPADVRAPVMIGFLGAYTTFSTWALESWRLVEDGAYVAAMVNVGASVILGFGAMILGLVIGRNV